MIDYVNHDFEYKILSCSTNHKIGVLTRKQWLNLKVTGGRTQANDWYNQRNQEYSHSVNWTHIEIGPNDGLGPKLAIRKAVRPAIRLLISMQTECCPVITLLLIPHAGAGPVACRLSTGTRRNQIRPRWGQPRECLPDDSRSQWETTLVEFCNRYWRGSEFHSFVTGGTDLVRTNSLL